MEHRRAGRADRIADDTPGPTGGGRGRPGSRAFSDASYRVALMVGQPRALDYVLPSKHLYAGL